MDKGELYSLIGQRNPELRGGDAVKGKLHPHAQARILERGATEREVIATVEHGEQFPAKFGRTGFRRNFPHAGQWRGKHCSNKQIEVIAVQEDDVWMVITVMVKYF